MLMHHQRRLALVFDIGGTTIKAGVISEEGKLLALHRQATHAKSPPEQVLSRIQDLGQRMCQEARVEFSQLEGVGFSIAAFVTAGGFVTATAHLSEAWLNYDMKRYLQNQWDTNYYFALDTPAPTLGEAYYGAGKGINDFVYVTVSTGIGAGIFANGHYYPGGLGWAGGVGHTIIDENSSRICQGCGNAGCLETFAATQGILTTAAELLRANPESKLLALVEGKFSNLTPKHIFDAAQMGDPTAQQVFSSVGHTLGIGLVNLIDIVAPTRVIIGGGIAQASDLLLEPVRSVVRTYAFPPRLRQVEIVQANLGDLSGIFGAAAMVFNDIYVNPEEEMN